MIQRPAPRYDADLYSDEAILDPYPHYAHLRELGPVVRLTRHRVYAVARYAECRAVLSDDATFRSGAGVGLNPISNRIGRGTTLNSDDDVHRARRSVVAHRLTPRALRSLSDQVAERAAETVAAALTIDGPVDGVADLACALPLSVVPDLVGWPEKGREHLLRWAGATFDVLGPLNARALRSTPAALDMLRFARRTVRHRDVLPGSLGADVLRAADEGQLPEGGCPALLVDYLGPSLDTTISAIASALHLFATHPEQWAALRSDPSLIPHAVNEVVRLESPLRAFSRSVATTTELGGVRLPAGARVLVVYASANRDPDEWTDPDTFDIRRDAARQLGFGYGTHGCAGQGLARLETTAILQAMVDQVSRIEVAGAPEWALNNIIHRYARLPLRLHPRESVS